MIGDCKLGAGFAVRMQNWLAGWQRAKKKKPGDVLAVLGPANVTYVWFLLSGWAVVEV